MYLGVSSPFLHLHWAGKYFVGIIAVGHLLGSPEMVVMRMLDLRQLTKAPEMIAINILYLLIHVDLYPTKNIIIKQYDLFLRCALISNIF
jgi:hypothetical protein